MVDCSSERRIYGGAHELRGTFCIVKMGMDECRWLWVNSESANEIASVR